MTAPFLGEWAGKPVKVGRPRTQPYVSRAGLLHPFAQSIAAAKEKILTGRKAFLDARPATLEDRLAFAGPVASSALFAVAPAAAGLVIDSTSRAPLVEDDILEIEQVSARLKRMKAKVREAACFHRQAVREWPSAMFTFTYGPAATVRAADMTRCLQGFKDYFRRTLKSPFRYVWVAEMQPGRAGRTLKPKDALCPLRVVNAPAELAGRVDPRCLHYHMIVWFPPSVMERAVKKNQKNSWYKLSGVLPKPDFKKWWPHGHTERDWCRTNPVSYISKYISKAGDLSIPKGFHMHSAGGFSAKHREARTYSARPSWLREMTMPHQSIARAPGGGFFDRVSGEVYPSPYRLLCAGALIVKVVKVCQEELARRRAKMKRRLFLLPLLADTASAWTLPPSSLDSMCF